MSKRPETGNMQFGDDWPGVFIRGDDALHFAMQIEMLLSSNDSSNPFLPAARVKQLKELLQRCRHGKDALESVQLLKDYHECVKEK